MSFGEGGIENDAQAIAKAKIPLTQAVTVAEQHANGKASRAEYENSKQGWVSFPEDDCTTCHLY